jgi:CRISPR-associated protein Cas5h
MSFSFPPPTAVAGLISGIVGLTHNASENAVNAAYWKELRCTRVAVAIRRPVRWLRAAVNFWNVKDPQKSPHIQIKHQFVSRPLYRIYVKNGIEERLREKLERNSFVYTPCLGVAYALAKISYLGHGEDMDAGSEKDWSVGTVLPFGEGVELDITRSGRVMKDVVPFRFDEVRSLLESKTVLYSDAGDNRFVLKKRGSLDITRSMDELVAWFPEW